MAWKTVESYRLGYNIRKKSFSFYYLLQGEGSVVHQIFPTPQDFLGLSQMFRNEGPIRFNTDGEYFITGPESIGEEEADPPPPGIE